MDCSVTLIDKKWLCKHASGEKLLKMAVSLKMRGIGASKHELNEFILMPIYSLGVNKHKQPVYAWTHREIYLVDGLKANMLIENDIIMPEDIMIDLANTTAFITSCNIKIAITARQRGQPPKKKLMADTTVFLLSNSKSLVPVIYGTLSRNRDFLSSRYSNHILLYLLIWLAMVREKSLFTITPQTPLWFIGSIDMISSPKLCMRIISK